MVKSFHSKNDVSSSGYEDNGSDTDEHPKQHSNQAKNISEIISANTKYKRLQKQNKTIETQVESDDEVFLLKVPKWINPTDLINSKFSTCKKSKVKTTSETYHMKPLHVAEPKLFINSVFLKKINPVSILQLEKYVEDKSKDDDITEERKHIPLPKDLTARHPIFGSKYEAKIQLQEEIQQKLQQALQRFEKTKKVPKQKKKVIDQDEFDDKSLLISQMLEEKLKSKKLKKTENTLMFDSSQTCDTLGSDVVEQKKKPKKQKNQVKIENNIEVQDIKNEIIIHNDHLLELNESKLIQSDDKEVEIHSTKEKKKKKKHKDSSTLETEYTDGFTRMPDDQEHFPLDRSMNEDEKNVTPKIKVELLSDADLNESSFRKKNKQKNKPEEIGNFSHIKQEFQENSEYTQSSPEKKRKKKKDNFSVEIKKEMVSESENPEPSFNEKKNKKRRRDSDITFMTPEIVKQEFDDSFMPPTKKRKPSILSSTVIKEASPEFKPDVSAIVMEEKAAKKKNKRKSTDNQSNIIQDLLSNVRSSLENVKVKSPKKKLL
ncbi:uncharacterized protein LOC123313862 [Coccinella septempunctata]|uniref:uncharacterized protein LOC123313862 n=1 Tax=Coccinella septempunctata TaxID=41139 RepID=UPI001D090D0E|nr:uncharacterized protein LOC123313862 [Coccinella septempunctata]